MLEIPGNGRGEWGAIKKSREKRLEKTTALQGSRVRDRKRKQKVGWEVRLTGGKSDKKKQTVRREKHRL